MPDPTELELVVARAIASQAFQDRKIRDRYIKEAWALRESEQAQEVENAVQFARAALAEAFRWRSIETAPKDGRPVLVWDGYYLMRIACFDLLLGRWRDELPYGSEQGQKQLTLKPTHWLPLPPPPDEGSER